MTRAQQGVRPAPLVNGTLWAFDDEGHVTIATPGAQPQIAATATLERMGGTPFFAGDAIDARTFDRLICIGQ